MAAVPLALLLSPASAQTVITPLERPDAASVTVPDMAGFKPTPKDARNFDDYFYFHKSGVSYERAFDDLEQCRVYAASAQLIAPMPTIIPVGDVATSGPKVSQRIGIGILPAILIASAEEDTAIATMRTCMAFKGYGRYGTSRALFKQIDQGSDTEKQARRAVIASGPAPAGEAIDP